MSHRYPVALAAALVATSFAAVVACNSQQQDAAEHKIARSQQPRQTQPSVSDGDFAKQVSASNGLALEILKRVTSADEGGFVGPHSISSALAMLQAGARSETRNEINKTLRFVLDDDALHASFNRFPELVESRYDQAFLHLATYCKKRSLVVLVSNLIDEVNSHQVEQYLGNLVGRHLPLGVLLRDHRLFEAAEHPNPRGEQLFRSAAAAEILTWRHQVLTDLTHRGVLALDLYPENMTAPLINQYLEVKARHLL